MSIQDKGILRERVTVSHDQFCALCVKYEDNTDKIIDELFGKVKVIMSKIRSTCFIANHEWGKCTCKTEVSVWDGFEFEGTTIVDPAINVDGTCFVEPTEYYGEAFINWRKNRKIYE